MLTQAQAREYNRFKKLGSFFVAETNVYSSFIPFATEVTNFTVNFQDFEALIPGKTETATGITTDKTTLKRKVATRLALVCRKTRSYALRFNQPELAAQTKTFDTKIFKMKDADILGYASSVVNLLMPLLPNVDYIPYGITATSLNDITELATSFNNLIGKARQSDSGNTTANTAIDRVIGMLHNNIIHFDLLIDQFEDSHPEFVQGYNINSSVDNVGIRHSGIEGTVRNSSGEVIAHATIQLDGTHKKVVTNLQGIYRLDRVAPDDYVVNVSASGYTSQQVVHRISRGKMNELDFHLAV
jgi:Carboxypeptidase regulatory-like domain